ncbi:unnamed protein product [Hymenolepis diminuta]|uniref:Uncharacterized protein n=1 Tax=Hymenolepis diminuta TaxID=6216 RepID=A0A564YTI7_HYMDI|nr:unnamed protein product [Hymenolepis diminuta]VUZ49868.1 unnamed protein product [Hymenolepis diminuta]
MWRKLHHSTSSSHTSPHLLTSPHIFTKLMEKLELLVPNTSSQRGGRQLSPSPKLSGTSSKHPNQISSYHRTDADEAADTPESTLLTPIETPTPCQ